LIEFNYIDAVEHDGDMIIWTRDTNGEMAVENLPATDFYYLFMPDNTGEGEYFNLHGNRMKKVNFENRHEMKEFATFRNGICESDVPPNYKAIQDLFMDCRDDIPMNFGLYDIEVDFDLGDGLGYPTPENPHGEVNFVSLYDRTLNEYKMFIPERYKGTIALDDSECPVTIYWHEDELELFINFKDHLEHIDIFTAWFGNGFDLPYMMARAFKIMAKKDAISWFCRDNIPARKREYVNEYKQDAVSWTLFGRHHVDMMELYKKFIPGEKPSFSLDAVGEIEGVGKKIMYDDDGDLGELLKANPQKFAEYSLHDTRLLKKLDDKLKIMDLAVLISRMASVRVADIVGSVKPIDHKMIKFCRKKGNYVLPDKTPHDKEKFPGAIVYDSIVGRYGWTLSIDLTALYPSVMIMLGLSPETYIFQCKHGYEDYLRVMTGSDTEIEVRDILTGDALFCSGGDLLQVIREEGYTISANGSVFNGSFGILSEFVQEIFMERKKNKKLSADYAKAGDNELHVIHDLVQKVLKIFANSVYGATSNVNFRLFDLDLAKSITLTGQMVSKHQAYKANALLEEYLEMIENE